MKKSSPLVFGTTSLSRLECRECKETTLHKFNKCIHCGTDHSGAPVRTVDTWRNSARR